MELSDYAKLSSMDLLIAEVQGKVNVTRYETKKPSKSYLSMTLTKTVRKGKSTKL
jgi:hypothetical protein